MTRAPDHRQQSVVSNDRPALTEESGADPERLAARNAELLRENAELRQQGENLRRSEELMRLAITQAGAVPYVLDYTTNTYPFIGEQILQLTGFSAAEVTAGIWLRIVQEQAMHGEQAGLSPPEAPRRTRAGAFQTWRTDYRIITCDGQTKWVSDASVEVLGERGIPTGSIGPL
jgi:PAS domain-containing protein